MRIIIATLKSWNIERTHEFERKYGGSHEIAIYTRRDELSIDNVRSFKPDYIFLPHWSYIIPNEITDNWECVVFHMTDLPFGRGGSPLQNLIVRGFKETKLSAIRVTQTLDGGPVYMKRPVSLAGSAQEIYVRCSDIIFNEMMPQFLEGGLVPKPQEGEPVVFKRRKPDDGKITPDMKLETIYDYIRMLDAEGYPRAFIEFGDYRLELEAASLDESGGEISARVKIKDMKDRSLKI